QAGAAFRADLNNALGAIVTTNSGAAAPSTTFGNMLWIDTTNNLVKKRNNANAAWQTFASKDFDLWLLGDGSVSAPAYSFSGDTDSGMYRIGANNLGIGVNGAKVLDIGVNGLGVTGYVAASASVAAGGGATAPSTGANSVQLWGTSPRVTWTDASQSANGRYVDALWSAGTFNMQFVNDAFSVGVSILAAVGTSAGLTSLKLGDGTGNIGIGTASFGTSAVNVIAIKNGTAPGSSPAGLGQLYVES